MRLINKKTRAQEEMVGFAIILIIVAVILLIFLSSSLKKSENEELQSYEVSGFIQAVLQYTTSCQTNRETLTIQKLIFECEKNENSICLDNKKTCDVLYTTLEEILKESWPVGEESPEKGYELVILADSEPLLKIIKGDFDRNKDNYRGANQEFSKSGVDIEIFANIYY